MKFLMLPVLLILYASSVHSSGPNTIQITGIECEPKPNWTTVEICNLKVGKDRQVKINARVMIIKPVTAAQIRFQIFRWYSGFKPFLIDFWTDGCKAMEQNAWMNVPTKAFIELVKRHTNLNHSCPFYGEVIIPSMTADLRMFPSMLQSGTYKLVATFAEKTHDRVIFVFSIKGIVSSPEL